MDKAYKINMIMTTQDLNSTYTQRFLQSIDNQPKDIKERFRLIAVIQHPCDKKVLVEGIDNIVIETTKRSLSSARNIGIKAIPDDKGIVSFPDDDCWCNDSIFAFVLDNFEKNDIDFFSSGIYDPIRNLNHGRHRVLDMTVELTPQNILFLPISFSIFYKFNSLSEIPNFDERFGVGTDWGSGEETDFLLQLTYMGKKGLYDSHDVVYHETGREKDFNYNSLYKYSVGFAVMMVKSKELRGQTAEYKAFKKMIFRNRLARIAFCFDKKRKTVYSARLKGFKDGIKIGKKVFKAN